MDVTDQKACEKAFHGLSYISLALETRECQKCQSGVFETPVDMKNESVLSGGIGNERETIGRQSCFEDG